MDQFKFEKLIELYNNCPKTNVGNKVVVFLSDDTKKYIDTYFFITNTGAFYFYDHNELRFQELQQKDLNSVYFNRLPETIKRYFYHESFKIYKCVMDVTKPIIFDNNINLFFGFIHQVKPFSTYSDAIKNKVNLYINFMKEVLASGDDDVLEYLLNWCSNVVKGNKNTSVLYLKGIEGIGKSTFSEFLQRYVIGSKNSVESDAQPLRTPYNKELCGKLLVVFEELPVFSDKEWEGISSTLKKSVTSSTQNYSDKFEKRFICENLNNYIINTNVEALKHSEGRRYFLLDVSTHRKQDYEYFGRIKNECFNNQVGEAFFNYLREIDTTSFNPQRMPETKSKKDALYDRLDYVYKFLKDEYLFKNKHVICTLTDLYGNYQNYCKNLDRKPYTKTNFTKKLREIGKDYYPSKGQNRYSIHLNELRDLAEKYNWIHDIDEYSINEEEEDTEETVSYTELVEINKQLRKKIKQLEKTNNSLSLLAVNPPKLKSEEPNREVEEIIDITTPKINFNYRSYRKNINEPKIETIEEPRSCGIKTERLNFTAAQLPKINFNFRAMKQKKKPTIDIDDQIMDIFNN